MRVKEKIIMKKIQDPFEDKAMYTINAIFVFIFVLSIIYPIIFIISASFSSGIAVATGQVVLWPVDPGIEGYRAVFSHKRILIGYRNTIIYTVLGTLINISITLIAAYPLSRPKMQFKKFYIFLFTFTMFFGGGIIPTYILMTQIKFINTIWAMIVPGALSVYNMIVVRTFFMNTIPNELLEAAQIDGCSDTMYFFKILLPLSKPIIAVITMFYAVGHWNAYFNALMYLNNPNMHPLQLVLREILIQNKLDVGDIEDVELMAKKQSIANLLKYSLIIVSSVPVICMYPFAQKYFIKGVMIGSIKG